MTSTHEPGRELEPTLGRVVDLATIRKSRGMLQLPKAEAGELVTSDKLRRPAVEPAGPSAPRLGADCVVDSQVVEGKLVEGELVEGELVEGRVLDQDAVAAAGHVVARRSTRGRDAQRRPILPPWLTDRSALVSTTRWAVGYGAHCTAFHAVRTPLYSGRLLLRSPIGVGRLVAGSARWIVDADGQDTWRVMTAQADAAVYLRLVQDRRRTVRARGFAIVAVAAILAVAGILVATLAPAQAQLVAVLAVLLLLGVIGRKRDRRMTGRAMDTAQVPPLTAELITSALSTLGLASITTAMRTQGDQAVRFLSIVRDGAGFRADIDLPGGATAGEVIDRRSKLASGLRRPVGCVWPEAAPDVHEGRLILYVADRSLSEAKPAAWPLAKTGKVNIFEPIQIGVDQRGRPVTVTLVFAAGLIGAVPRMGKTRLMLLLLLAAALDPRVEIHAFNLKGGPDLDSLEAVAHAYRSGDDPGDIAALVADLEAMNAEMRRRYALLRRLPKEVCPEAKVTDELASDRSLGLHPIFAAYDETQVMFEHATHGKRIEQLVTDLVKRGPAVGIMVWLATQRPDSTSIPTGISANAVLRVCLKVMGQVENDMVLGTSAYKAGTRATMFSRKDLGIAILAGEGEDPVIVRGHFIDSPAAEAIAARARAVRAAQGRLTGLAAGDDTGRDDNTGSILDHLLAVWPADPDRGPSEKVWNDDLAGRLAAFKPSLYEGWTGEQITAAVSPHGIKTVQVKRKHDGRDVNKRGLNRHHITDALGHQPAGSGVEFDRASPD